MNINTQLTLTLTAGECQQLENALAEMKIKDYLNLFLKIRQQLDAAARPQQETAQPAQDARSNGTAKASSEDMSAVEIP